MSSLCLLTFKITVLIYSTKQKFKDSKAWTLSSLLSVSYPSLSSVQFLCFIFKQLRYFSKCWVSASLLVWLLFMDTETLWNCEPSCLPWTSEGIHMLEDVALSPPVCLARWALLRQTYISAPSRQICYLGIHCLWKLASSQAIVANSVKLALDNNNSNALLFKGLSRGFGDCVGCMQWQKAVLWGFLIC